MQSNSTTNWRYSGRAIYQSQILKSNNNDNHYFICTLKSISSTKSEKFSSDIVMCDSVGCWANVWPCTTIPAGVFFSTFQTFW